MANPKQLFINKKEKEKLTRFRFKLKFRFNELL